MLQNLEFVMILLFITLVAIGNTLASQDEISQCCKNGKDTALELRRKGYSQCNSALKEESASSNKQCQRVFKICCLKGESELSCSKGAQNALRADFRKCEFSPESNTRHGSVYLRCCHCCQLGIAAVKSQASCQMSYDIDQKCGEKFSECCVAQREASNGPTTCEAKQCNHDCKMSNGAPVCSCRSGFKLHSDGLTCEDIDECQGSTRRCLEGYTCKNLIGSFSCLRPVKKLDCPRGYIQVDSYCRDDDECASGKANCPAGTQCFNTLGSFKCSAAQRDPVNCPKGYYTNNGRCIDVNECLISNPCNSSEKCVNTFGSYKCEENNVACPKGFRHGTSKLSCLDIDECTENLHGCKGEGEGCINLPGLYRCTCKKGYMRDKFRCVDRDECKVLGKRLCSHHCINLPGSFKCACQKGFELAKNQRTCLDIDECTEATCPDDHECYNAPGTYKCIPAGCPNNYVSVSMRVCKLRCPFGVDCSRLPSFTKWNALSRNGPLARYKFRFLYKVDDRNLPLDSRIIFSKAKGDKKEIFGFRTRRSRILIFNKKPIEESSQYAVTFQAKSSTDRSILMEYSLYLFVHVR